MPLRWYRAGLSSSSPVFSSFSSCLCFAFPSLFPGLYSETHKPHLAKVTPALCETTTEDPDFPPALRKGSPEAGRFKGPAQPGGVLEPAMVVWAVWGAQPSTVLGLAMIVWAVWGAQAGTAGWAQQGHGADGAGHQKLKCDFSRGCWHTHLASPSVQSSVRVVSLQWQGSCVWILRVVCPKSFEKQLGSSMDPTISTGGRVQHLDHQSTALCLSLCTGCPDMAGEAQDTLGLSGFFLDSSGHPWFP